MNAFSKNKQDPAEEIFTRFGTMLYRNSIVMLRNQQDAEDMVQDTLLKYMEHKKEFHDDEHRKAWLLRVNINLCKNRLRFNRTHAYLSLEELGIPYETKQERQLMETVMELPAKYKEILLLHYVEGYQVREIAAMTEVSEHAVKKRLERARNRLSKQLEKDGAENERK